MKRFLLGRRIVIHWNSVWITMVATKVFLSHSQLLGGVILKVENLNLRKHKVVCISWCYLYKEEAGENEDHLLLHCSLDKRKCAIC